MNHYLFFLDFVVMLNIVNNYYYYYNQKISNARLGESDLHPISPKTPPPQCKLIERKKIN